MGTLEKRFGHCALLYRRSVKIFQSKPPSTSTDHAVRRWRIREAISSGDRALAIWEPHSTVWLYRPVPPGAVSDPVIAKHPLSRRRSGPNSRLCSFLAMKAPIRPTASAMQRLQPRLGRGDAISVQAQPGGHAQRLALGNAWHHPHLAGMNWCERWLRRCRVRLPHHRNAGGRVGWGAGVGGAGGDGPSRLPARIGFQLRGSHPHAAGADALVPLRAGRAIGPKAKPRAHHGPRRRRGADRVSPALLGRLATLVALNRGDDLPHAFGRYAVGARQLGARFTSLAPASDFQVAIADLHAAVSRPNSTDCGS
ncbi:hypothetical protein AX27061_3508 [Achromobacter xylosoxidans NBRC 15126 = ATCC 27061]|nr:hypothetical protein AX27061_3508 [Achromobacter xylosoxidans NBRC 15126 = ATCC 27061]